MGTACLPTRCGAKVGPRCRGDLVSQPPGGGRARHETFEGSLGTGVLYGSSIVSGGTLVVESNDHLVCLSGTPAGSTPHLPRRGFFLLLSETCRRPTSG